MSKFLRVITASFALLVLFVFGLAASARAQTAITPTDSRAIVKAMDNAMEPGDGQKRLDFLVGTFDVKVLIWIEPSQPPIESTATAVASWVLGHRYVQQMLSGFVMGEAWNGIGYAGYDNVARGVRGLLHGHGQHGHGVVHGKHGSGRQDRKADRNDLRRDDP